MFMKVISIKQPWASLIIEGYKEYEFRTWKTKYRGEIFIHASKTFDNEAMEKYKNLNLKYPTGCIIGKAILNDCIEVNHDFKKLLESKNKYPYIYDHIINGDKNKFGFNMTKVEKIEPIFVKGQLGIWNFSI